MAKATEDSKKQSYLLFEFLVDGTYYRYTNWGSDIDPNGANWESVPAIEVDWPSNEGTLDPGFCKVTVDKAARASLTTLCDLLVSDGGPVAPVTLVIYEVVIPVISGDTGSERVAFRGKLYRAVANAGGRARQVRLEARNPKAGLDATLGIPCGHHCPWRFMGNGCAVQGGPAQKGPQFGAVSRNIQITSFSGKTVTLASDPGLAAGRSMRFGYLAVDDLRISVFDWDPLAPTLVILRQQPPPSWTGALALVVPGCDKTLTNCQAWNNEANFGGIGYAIPPYNPIFEDGSLE